MSFALFCELRTQWRMGMSGPTGLDYSAMYRELDEQGFTGEERDLLKQDVRVMEGAALAAMYEK